MSQPRMNGRFAKGGTVDEEVRKKISQSNLKVYARKRKEPKPPRPATKVCTRCKKEKDTEKDFLVKKCKYKLMDGSVRTSTYISSECRKCNADRAAEHRAKLVDLGLYEEKVKEWESRRDREHVNKMHRRWYKKQRGKKFTLPWKRYRRGYRRQGIYYRTTEVLEYLKRFRTEDKEDGFRLNGRRMTETHVRAWNRWKNKEVNEISEYTLDAWATYYDLPLWEIEDVAVPVAA